MANSPRIKFTQIVLRLIENPNGILFADLENDYGFSDRTIRNYISDLQQIPELMDRECISRVEVDGWQESRRVYLRAYDRIQDDGAGHIVSLYFAISMLRFLRGTSLEDPIDGLFKNLYQGKNRTLFYKLDKNIYSINEWPKDYSKKSDILRDCIHSLIHRKVLKINYKAAGRHEFKEHHLKIYTLLQYRNGLYLIGKTEKGERITVFALERITRAEKTRETFNYPAGYSPEDYIDGAFGLIRSDDQEFFVVINFDRCLEDVLAARKWHKTASLKKLKNGTLQLSMTVSALQQVVPWVLGFGGLAKVLKPKELKMMVCSEVKALSELYQ